MAGSDFATEMARERKFSVPDMDTHEIVVRSKEEPGVVGGLAGGVCDRIGDGLGTFEGIYMVMV